MIRALGVDDGFFRRPGRKAPLIAILMRGTLVEGVLHREITVDGDDVTDALIDILLRSKYTGQAGVIFTSGTMFAGTNVLDLPRIYEVTKIPVVAVLRRPPSERFDALLAHLSAEKRTILERNPPFEPMETKRGTLYIASLGLDSASVKRVVEDYQIYSVLPEPLRLAHVVASALGLGESRGRP